MAVATQWNASKPAMGDQISLDIPDIEENFEEIQRILEAITNGTLGVTDSDLYEVKRKIGTFTRDTAIASGDQVIGGVGFKPSNIIFLGNITSTPQVTIGFDNGTNHYSVSNIHEASANNWYIYTSYSLYFREAGTLSYKGIVSALGVDGFTITWLKTDAKTGTANIHYMAFG